MSLFIPPTFLETKTTPALGFVANRARWFTNSETTNKQIMARSGHKTLAAVTSLKVAFTNARNSTAELLNDFNGEVGLGAGAIITASVEYPAGVFTQIKFSTVSSTTIADKGLVVSDTVSVTIPANTIFWIRQFWTNVNGVFFNAWQDTVTYGDAVTKSVSGGTDLTMSGTVTDNSGWSFPPAAIIATTSLPSIGIVGDSIGYGAIDDVSPHLGDTGIIAKSLQGHGIPFQNLSQCGQGMYSGAASNRYWLTSGTPRKLLLPYCSHIICQLGTNDIDGATGSTRTAAQLQTDVTALFAALKANGLPSTSRFVQTTIVPHSTSTDNWLTLVNQTPDVTEPQRVLFNTAMRSVVPGINNVIDVAPVLESSVNSGLWTLGRNFLGRSNDFPFFSSLYWSQTASSVAQGGFADPFGTTAAWQFVEDSGAGPHFNSSPTHKDLQAFSPSPLDPGTYTFSTYAKLGSGRRLELRVANVNQDFAYVVFDLSGVQVGTQGVGTNGGPGNTITNVSSSIITDLFATGGGGGGHNGWYRCIMTISSTSTVGGVFYVLDKGIGKHALNQDYVGDGTSNCFIFGAQLESGSAVTGYLPTAKSGPALTSDGLHPEPSGYSFVVNSGVVHY